jgi:DNA-directed RNA polymerase specialized sigma24 family protein
MGLRNPRPWSDREFQALLAWLHPDPGQSGAAYAKLHQRLRLFFEGWRDAARYAEELADATIDRAVRKLADDPGLAAREPTPYIRTIASYILKEYRSRPQSLALTIDVPDTRGESGGESFDEKRCLNRCLGRLSTDDYELIVGYYAHEKAEDATKWRKELLPEKLGKSYGAVRVQVLRIRRTLEECIDRCRNASHVVTLRGPEYRHQ